MISNRIDGFDDYVYELVSGYASDSLTNFMKAITNLGGTVFILEATIGILLILKDKKLRYAAVLNLIFESFLNNLFKTIFKRQRPSILRLVGAGGYSFPSGHAMASVAFYGFLIYIVYKNVENKYLKFFLIFLMVLIILLIGLSRIYLGVHFASDVIGGFTLGLSYILAFIYVYEKICNVV